MAPKAEGGIRQRLGLNAPPDEPAEVSAASSSSGLRGGIRSRVLTAANEDGGPRRKARKCSGPLVTTLKKQWGKGELSARQVEEIVTSAAAQGADGVTKHVIGETSSESPAVFNVRIWSARWSSRGVLGIRAI